MQVFDIIFTIYLILSMLSSLKGQWDNMDIDLATFYRYYTSFHRSFVHTYNCSHTHTQSTQRDWHIIRLMIRTGMLLKMTMKEGTPDAGNKHSGSIIIAIPK